MLGWHVTKMLSLLRERGEFLSEYFAVTQKTVIGLPGLIVPGDYSLRQNSCDLFTWNNGVYGAIFSDVRFSGQGARY